MEKKYFVLHLLPVRPDFAFTMTDEERAVMLEHVAYWKEKMAKGQVLVYGPVFDPEGPYGLGIIAVDEEREVTELINDDPAGKINKYEYYPMRAILPDRVP